MGRQIYTIRHPRYRRSRLVWAGVLTDRFRYAVVVMGDGSRWAGPVWRWPAVANWIALTCHFYALRLTGQGRMMYPAGVPFAMVAWFERARKALSLVVDGVLQRVQAICRCIRSPFLPVSTGAAYGCCRPCLVVITMPVHRLLLLQQERDAAIHGAKHAIGGDETRQQLDTVADVPARVFRLIDPLGHRAWPRGARRYSLQQGHSQR